MYVQALSFYQRTLYIVFLLCFSTDDTVKAVHDVMKPDEKLSSLLKLRTEVDIYRFEIEKKVMFRQMHTEFLF